MGMRRARVVSPSRNSDRRCGAPKGEAIKNEKEKSCVCVGCGCDLRTLSGPRSRAGSYSRSVKEVIQPQVPLRLPCYDFAPVTALAFGRLPPCGLRHGLRALTASMA